MNIPIVEEAKTVVFNNIKETVVFTGCNKTIYNFEVGDNRSSKETSMLSCRTMNS